ncbi:hypothetical protein IQ241_20435 [Romeria aff. gracilis LEGE 07310]|uniref:Uncharacterized protein n=1 Tax=Vasconcelosia minhoensis LEGE 07310 TaxID=915328 RepID=A0A8J7ASN8_9CYAN|nr:hypothetical protein [Romeria gracilis]MBE9079635.1 hypothetical protein [Romeria aff. gracilis LEGE 07310]
MTTQPKIYPMPAFPTLKVRDVVASTRWYQDAVNFQQPQHGPDHRCPGRAF